MIPNLVIFNKVISPYMIFTLIGIFTIGIYTAKVAKKYNIDDVDVIFTLLISSIGVLLGAHLLYGITNFEIILKVLDNPEIFKDFKMLLLIFTQIFGGAVFYGGLFAGLLFGYSYIKIKQFDIASFVKILVPAIPLFHFFGRLGCFTSGCCYGIESKFGFVYKYAFHEIGINGVRRFPVQLFEAGFNLALFFVLYKIKDNDKYSKYLLHIYLICYSVARFILEFLRGDAIRGVWFGLSTSQYISIAAFSVATFLLVKRVISNQKSK